MRESLGAKIKDPGGEGPGPIKTGRRGGENIVRHLVNGRAGQGFRPS